MDELTSIQLQINELQQKAQSLIQQKKAEVIREVKSKIASYGITAKDLGLGEFVKTSTVAAKYRHGDQTWTGRGRQPKFVVDYLATGGKLEDLLIGD